MYGNRTEVVTKGRHDPCVGIRGVPVAEAMVALVIMDHVLRTRAYDYDREFLNPVGVNLRKASVKKDYIM